MKLSSIRVKRANLSADLNEMTVLMERMKAEIGKSLSNMFMKVQKTYENVVGDNKLNIQADLVDRWKKMEIHF